MADIVAPAIRSRMMAGIRSRDTQPEVKIRKALHAAGFRYRLHRKDLPGTPDIVLPKYRAVLFVHGCFWHGHKCPLFKWPATRPEFWKAKIDQNKSRDHKVQIALDQAGWRRIVIWECALRGKTRLDFGNVVEQMVAWIKGGPTECEITGQST